MESKHSGCHVWNIYTEACHTVEGDQTIRICVDWRKIPWMNEIRNLTGLPNDNFVGHSGAMVVVGCTLVRSLVSLSLFPADVDDQSSWAGLHQDFGVFLHIKVGPISCPWKAGGQQNSNHHCISLSIRRGSLSWCVAICSRRQIWIIDSTAGRLMDSSPFDSEVGGETELCLIRSDRCALQEFSMTTVAMLIHISIVLVKSPPETGL